ICFLRALEANESREKSVFSDNAGPLASSVVIQARYTIGLTRLGNLLVSLSSAGRAKRSAAPDLSWPAEEREVAADAACALEWSSVFDVVSFKSRREKRCNRTPGIETKGLTSSAALNAEWAWWLAALLCVAGGFLTKWTAPIFFYSTAISLLYLRGRLRILFTRPHLISASLAAGVCIGWVAVAIGLAGWASFYSTVSREALARIFPRDYGGVYRWHEVLIYPFRIFATNLPWSAFALVAIR